MSDEIKNPKHYTSHPSGLECIEVAGYFPFALGSAIKYIWRRGPKDDEVKDLRKAIKFLELHIEHDLPPKTWSFAVNFGRKLAGTFPPNLEKALIYICEGQINRAIDSIELEIAAIEANKKPIEIEPPTEDGLDLNGEAERRKRGDLDFYTAMEVVEDDIAKENEYRLQLENPPTEGGELHDVKRTIRQAAKETQKLKKWVANQRRAPESLDSFKEWADLVGLDLDSEEAERLKSGFLQAAKLTVGTDESPKSDILQASIECFEERGDESHTFWITHRLSGECLGVHVEGEGDAVEAEAFLLTYPYAADFSEVEILKVSWETVLNSVARGPVGPYKLVHSIARSWGRGKAEAGLTPEAFDMFLKFHGAWVPADEIEPSEDVEDAEATHFFTETGSPHRVWLPSYCGNLCLFFDTDAQRMLRAPRSLATLKNQTMAKSRPDGLVLAGFADWPEALNLAKSCIEFWGLEKAKAELTPKAFNLFLWYHDMI